MSPVPLVSSLIRALAAFGSMVQEISIEPVETACSFHIRRTE